MYLHSLDRAIRQEGVHWSKKLDTRSSFESCAPAVNITDILLIFTSLVAGINSRTWPTFQWVTFGPLTYSCTINGLDGGMGLSVEWREVYSALICLITNSQNKGLTSMAKQICMLGVQRWFAVRIGGGFCWLSFKIYDLPFFFSSSRAARVWWMHPSFGFPPLVCVCTTKKVNEKKRETSVTLRIFPRVFRSLPPLPAHTHARSLTHTAYFGFFENKIKNVKTEECDHLALNPTLILSWSFWACEKSTATLAVFSCPWIAQLEE